MNIIASLAPVFALLMGGYLLKRSGFPGDSFWPPAERFIYFICFPALLLNRLSDAKIEGAVALDLLWAVMILLAVATPVLLFLQRLLRFGGPQFTSIYQGSVRFNTYIALAIAAGIWPQQGVVYAAIIAAVMIPPLNILCVLIFAIYQDNRPSPARVMLNIIQNPLIVACLLGLGLNFFDVPVPTLINDILSLLADIALPLGLLAVGAALNLKSLHQTGLPLLTTLVFRLVLMPLLALVSAALLGLSGDIAQILLIFAAVPAASAAYILARQLGGDAPLMAAILSAQTLVAMLTLPLIFALGRQLYPYVAALLSS